MRRRKGVSPMVSTVLLTAIVVVIGTAVALWAATSFSIFGGGMGNYLTIREEQLKENLIIEHVQFIYKNKLRIFLRNVGTVESNVHYIYVLDLNDTSNHDVIELDPKLEVLVGELENVTVTVSWNWSGKRAYQIKVSTTRGNVVSEIYLSSYIVREPVYAETILLTISDPDVTYGQVTGSYTNTHNRNEGLTQDITESVVAVPSESIVNGGFDTDASGWNSKTTGDAVVGYDSNEGNPPGSVYASVSGKNKLGTGVWYQDITVDEVPASAQLQLDYMISHYSKIDSFVLNISIVLPTGSTSTLETITIQGTTSWITKNYDVSSLFTQTGVYRLKLKATIDTSNIPGGEGRVYWDNVSLDLYHNRYILDVRYTFQLDTTAVPIANVTRLLVSVFSYTTGEPISVYIYDFSTASWVFLVNITTTSMDWTNSSITSGFSNYISATGTIYIRFATAYDTNQDTLYIDYLAIKVRYYVKG